jgi:hypothetical protein
MKWLTALFAFLSLTASAQTLKWSFTVDGPVYGWATDGYGGLVVCHNPPPFGNCIRTTWIDGKGRPVLTNDICITEGVVDDIDVKIVRFNKSEVALQVEVGIENADNTNYLHRINRAGTVSDTPLDVEEVMDAKPSTLVDGQGFFTRMKENFYTFRRYSN